MVDLYRHQLTNQTKQPTNLSNLSNIGENQLTNQLTNQKKNLSVVGFIPQRSVPQNVRPASAFQGSFVTTRVRRLEVKVPFASGE